MPPNVRAPESVTVGVEAKDRPRLVHGAALANNGCSSPRLKGYRYQMAHHSKSAAMAAGVLLAGAVLSSGTTARAEATAATGKGITGGALVGAEAVLVTEVLLGVQSQWILGASAIGGAVGGGVGGYFLEQNASPRFSFYVLLGGMAMVIPTTIIYMDAMERRRDVRVYDPEAEPFDGPDADPPGVDAEFSSIPAPEFRSLVGVSANAFALSVPHVEISPVYTQAEVQELGVEQGTQVMFPLLQGLF